MSASATSAVARLPQRTGTANWSSPTTDQVGRWNCGNIWLGRDDLSGLDWSEQPGGCHRFDQSVVGDGEIVETDPTSIEKKRNIVRCCNRGHLEDDPVGLEEIDNDRKLKILASAKNTQLSITVLCGCSGRMHYRGASQRPTHSISGAFGARQGFRGAGFETRQRQSAIDASVQCLPISAESKRQRIRSAGKQ